MSPLLCEIEQEIEDQQENNMLGIGSDLGEEIEDQYYKTSAIPGSVGGSGIPMSPKRGSEAQQLSLRSGSSPRSGRYQHPRQQLSGCSDRDLARLKQECHDAAAGVGDFEGVELELDGDDEAP